MKKLANGEVRLAKNERRIGNFLVKEEPGHMKLTDLGGVMSFRVSKKMPVGVWLYNLYKRKDDSAEDTLKVFVSTVWSTLSVVPDDEYIQLLLTSSRACLERHKEWYGMKDVTDEEDAKIIEEEKELSDFAEKVKEMPDAEVSDGEQEA